MRNSQHLGSGLSKRDAWDDEFILKRHFSALIPAFDPRPGRTNVNQTSDIDIPPPAEDCFFTSSTARFSEESSSGIESIDITAGGKLTTEIHQPPQIHLTLKGPNLPGSNTFFFLLSLLYDKQLISIFRCI